MKKILMLLAFAAGITITGFAQQPQSAPTSQSTSSSQTSSPNQKNPLNLTSDQQSKMSQIKSDEKAKKNAINSNSSLSAADKASQIKDLKKNSKMQRDNLLTDDQKNMQKQLKAQHKAAHKGSHKSKKTKAQSSMDEPAQQ